jgi:hypothetical protein
MRRMLEDRLMSSASLLAEARPQRRWYQFGLRTLFLLTTFIVGLLALWRAYVEPYRQQREAMEVIKQLGGMLETSEATAWQRWLFGDGSQNVTFVNLADCDLVEQYFPHIAALQSLEMLVVGGPHFTDEYLGHVVSPKLRGLVLDSTAISDGALAEWREQFNDVNVRLSQRRSIAELRKRGFTVETVVADESDWLVRRVGQEFAEDATRVVAGHPRRGPGSAIELARAETLGGDLDLRLLSCSRRSLTCLYLSGTSIGDEALAHFGGFNDLARLYLIDTSITDTGLHKLRSLGRLKVLAVLRTRVTSAGIVQLKEYLPECDILSSLPK